ncbi:MAG: glycosyltransferase family 4 protein [Acidobacteriia bacterium]|nr:glycosyltransferase family 4 protein [Terriglobia bacterium]
MKIALDATYSAGPNLSGVGVYSREILHGLAHMHPDPGVRWLWCYRPHRFLKSLRIGLPRRCGRRLLLDRLVPDAALFHGLNQRLPSTPLRRSVTTFHDLFVLTGEYSSPEFRQRFAEQARQAAARSDLIIAVSAFTAGQVEQLLGVERSRIRVVPHGVHPSSPGIPEKIILSVGALQKRKNTIRLVEAFERCPPGWKLVLAGSHGYEAGEALSRIEASPRRADIELTGYVDDVTLQGWYGRAGIFAFPSLDEGFGMPVLEAMSRGIPVLTSNRGALPEVSLDAALLVDPESTGAIADGLRRLITDESLQQTLRRKGLLRAAQFSWENAVKRTWQVYLELV